MVVHWNLPFLSWMLYAAKSAVKHSLHDRAGNGGGDVSTGTIPAPVQSNVSSCTLHYKVLYEHCQAADGKTALVGRQLKR
jgi:hypothetical protein